MNLGVAAEESHRHCRLSRYGTFAERALKIDDLLLLLLLKYLCGAMGPLALEIIFAGHRPREQMESRLTLTLAALRDLCNGCVMVADKA